LNGFGVMSQALIRWLLILALVVFGAQPAQARRLALVIGNDGYTKLSKLSRAGADAEGVANELKAAGFEVSLHRDLSNTRFAVVVSEFYDKVKKGDDVVVFYAGHGIQTERGAQLLPIDIEGDTEFVVERLSQPVNGLLDSLERLQPRMALLIIDACRDNPMRAQGRTIGAARGLSGPNVARGQMLMFSAASRERALDKLGNDDTHPNGVFTRELIARMRTPGVPFEQVAKEVQAEVEKLAASINHKQRPLIVNDSIGDFAFYPAGAVAAVASAASAAPAVAQAAAQTAAQTAAEASNQKAAREDRFWDSVVKTDSADAYRGYLERYPGGDYVLVARAAIAKLADRPAAVVAQNTRGANEVAKTAPVEPSLPSEKPPETGLPVLSPVVGTTAGASPGVSPGASVPTPTGSGTGIGINIGIGGIRIGIGTGTGAPRPTSTPSEPAPVAPVSGNGARPTVTYSLANGDSFSGEVQANRRTGRGVYRFASGDRYEGEFANDQFLGQGVLTYANGNRYEGQFEDGLYHGKGTLTAANGERYAGNYQRGLRQGQGELVFADKGSYTGSFDNNKPHGKGVSRHPSGEVFEGDHVHGTRSGSGTYRFANGDVYEGQFVDNLHHGSGSYAFANGARYVGSYQRGLKQGQGEFVFADKGRYTGPFDNDKAQGKGVYVFANGDRYEGDFDSGLFNGRGTLYLANGDRYEGAFAKNVKEGQGVHYFVNKDRYEGGFRNGVQHGLGTHYFASGDRFVGSFADGQRHGKGVHHFASGQTNAMEYVNGAEKTP
jgi:uncharacterized caspase-like protein